MIPTILSHQWKAFWRGRNAGKSMIMQLLMGFIILYLLATCFVLGFYLHHILGKLFPGRDIIRIYCGILLYYFVVDLAMRYLFQDLPVLSVQPYLIQNIRRRQLLKFLTVRSLFHFFNLLPLILFIPFVITAIPPAFGPMAASALGLSILSLVVANHFYLLYIKRQSVRNAWWLPGFFGAFALLIALDYFGVLSLSALSAFFFLGLLRAPWLVVVPLTLALIAIVNNRRFLRRSLYIEDYARGQKIRRSTEYSWLRQLGVKSDLIALDLKLIFRNKRTKNLFIIALLTPIYGLTIFRPEALHSGYNAMQFTGAFIITGSFIMNFGQFTFAWQSNHFDGLLASPVGVGDFIRAKLVLYTVMSTFAMIAGSFFGLLDWHIVPIVIATWLYNIGFNSILVVWLATFKYKAVDMNAGMFQSQGISAVTWVSVLLVALAPLVFEYVFDAFHHSWIAISILGAIGAVCLPLRTLLINRIVHEFYKRKYLILEGFREQ